MSFQRLFKNTNVFIKDLARVFVQDDHCIYFLFWVGPRAQNLQHIYTVVFTINGMGYVNDCSMGNVMIYLGVMECKSAICSKSLKRLLI